MYKIFHFFLFLLIIVKQTQSYVGMSHVNTDRGYCTYTNGVLIPVGDYIIDKVKCQRIACEPGTMKVTGCGVSQAPQYPFMICKLVRGPGYFPDCCPNILKCTKYPIPTLPPLLFFKNTTDDQDDVTTSSSGDVLLREINKRVNDFESSGNHSDTS